MVRRKQNQTLYKIGQVAKMTGLQPFVLRFWEKEFNFKLPKAESGHRYYRQEDVQKILMIKRLLYTEGFTIKGAMQKLKWGEVDMSDVDSKPQHAPLKDSGYRKVLQGVRHDVASLLQDLENLAVKTQ